MRLARFLAVPLIVLPVAWLLLLGIGRDPRAIPSALIDRPAPPVVATSMDGQSVRLEAYRGRPVVLNFWASWCFECIEEHRVLLEAQERYGERLVIIGILYQDSVAGARDFLARHGDGGWPSLLDPDGRLAIDYGVTGVPESFFIDAAGVVRYKQYGPVTREILDQVLAGLVATAARTLAPAAAR